MNHYDITVIYACHGLETDPRKPFPAQNFPADGLQIVSVWENDPFDPRKKFPCGHQRSGRNVYHIAG